MSRLLTFTNAQVADPAIVEWWLTKPTALAALARPWFTRLRGCGPDVRELFHDGCPVLCVEDAPFGYVNVFSAHAAVGFFRGASLPDPSGLLEGSGRYMRHVKVRPGVAVDTAALDALVAAAYHDIVARVHAMRADH